MNRLILIEGIPGSGKTTMAEKVKQHLESKGQRVKMFQEGELHPADLAWLSVIPLKKFEEIRRLPIFEGRWENHVSIEGDLAIIAYTQLRLPEEGQEWMVYFDQHEVYDQRVPFEDFRRLHFERWKRFSRDADPETVYIFECAYLQNHISEMLRAHEMTEEAIIRYMKSLIQTVETMNPKLIYLSQPDVRETIQRVAEERRSPEPKQWKDWIDLVAEYVEDSPFGKDTHASGFEAVIQFIQARKALEFRVMEKLDIDVNVIDNPVYDWADVERRVMACLDA